jgi:hypothetical protein
MNLKLFLSIFYRFTSTHVTDTSFLDQEVSLRFVFFTHKFCLYSEFNLDLFISFLIYANLVNKKLKMH